MLIMGLLITTFYWNTEQFSAIKQVSVYMMILIMTYIALHFMKRFAFNVVYWWDWLYYIALVTIMCSALLANSENENFFHWALDIASLLFIVPILIDIKMWLNSRNTEE